MNRPLNDPFVQLPIPTREEAEQEAVRQAAGLLGNNVDRNTSRVNNWS